MGAVFALPWARLADHGGTPGLLREAGFTVAALALSENSMDLAGFARALTPSDKVAILLGTEGHGLSQRWMDGSDAIVRIRMHAGIDSLNVAATSAIACYALA